MKKPRHKQFDIHQMMEDTPGNRKTMFQNMLTFDQQDAIPFWLVVTKIRGILRFVWGPDVQTSAVFVIAEWTPWYGIKTVDLPIGKIRFVKHV